MAILTAKKVTKRFGGLDALRDVDLELREQSIQSLIGPNGAGKTTFFNCVTGFYNVDEGEIFLRARPTGREGNAAVEEARRLLRIMGLAGQGDMLAVNLPYGSQRRLEIARALATKPKLLLLDEPTAGMNPREPQDMR